MIPWQSNIGLETSPISERMVDNIANIDRTDVGRMVGQERILSLLSRSKVVAGAEIRCTSAEYRIGGKRVIPTSGSEVDLINYATTNTPGRICVERLSQSGNRVSQGNNVSGRIVALGE